MATLITGAGGFVGSHLAERLGKKEVDCLVYKKARSFLDGSEFNCIKGDVTDRGFVRKIVKDYDRVYHLASLLNYSSPTLEEFVKVNVEGTRNVMEASLDYGVKKVVFTSSRVTINEEGSGRVNEDYLHRDFFDNSYSMTKYRGEKIAFEYGARGLPVTVVNPTLIYGPREMHTTGPLIKNYLEQRIRLVGFLESRFNLVYVRDVVDAHIAAMKKGKPGSRYILGGEEVRIGDFLSMLDVIAGVDKPVISLPGSLVEFSVKYLVPIARGIGIRVPISKEQIYAMKTDTLVDVSKAKKELGLKVTPLRRGLEETIKWYRESGYIS